MVDVNDTTIEVIGQLEVGMFRDLAFVVRNGQDWLHIMEKEPWPAVDGRPIDGDALDEFIEEKTTTGVGTEYGPNRFYVRLDGSVFYENTTPSSLKVILFEDVTFFDVDLPAGHSIIVKVGVLHTYPHKLVGTIDLTVWRRGTNGLDFVEPSLGIVRNPYNTHRIQGFQALSASDFKEEKYDMLPALIDKGIDGFHKDVDASHFTNQYEQKKERFTPARWPKSKFPTSVDSMTQDFTMSWRDRGETEELMFHGHTGTLKDKEGFPGVSYHKKTKQLSINLLLRRTDGSFFIATHGPGQLAMIIASPGARGEPIADTVRCINFREGVKLPVGTWHSVPFPQPNIVPFLTMYEIVARTNASEVINLTEEIGRQLVVQLYN